MPPAQASSRCSCRASSPAASSPSPPTSRTIPGFADVIQGPWLMEQMQKQAEHVGTQLFFDTIVEVELDKRPFVCIGDSGDRYESDALIIATGATAKWLGLPTRGELPRRRRVGLRHLRRLLLPRQGSRGGRRRQHRGRGSALSDPSRHEGDADPSPRQLPRGEDPAGAAVQEPEDHRDVGSRRRRRSPASASPRRWSRACACRT